MEALAIRYSGAGPPQGPPVAEKRRAGPQVGDLEGMLQPFLSAPRSRTFIAGFLRPTVKPHKGPLAVGWRAQMKEATAIGEIPIVSWTCAGICLLTLYFVDAPNRAKQWQEQKEREDLAKIGDGVVKVLDNGTLLMHDGSVRWKDGSLRRKE